jgi:hypothetical protein
MITQIIRRYNAYLVTRASSLGTINRSAEIRVIMAPWIIPIAIGGLLCYALNLDSRARLITLAPFAMIGLGGMIYAGCVFFASGLRTDVKRLRAGKREH